jgi:hypothetical protein
LKEIPPAEISGLYGVVVAASSTVSKKARDQFFLWCSDAGLKEAHLWGREELEDALFQPKNDHLLFAYFGISLKIRERSRSTQIRRRLALKRKAKRLLDSRRGMPILLRNIDDDSYPCLDDVELLRRKALWRFFQYEELQALGLKVASGFHYAYLDPVSGDWDVAFRVNRDAPDEYDDPWLGSSRGQIMADEVALRALWLDFPEEKRAMAKVWGIIEYDMIIDIDELGDEHFDGPHVFARVVQENAFCTYSWGAIYPDAGGDSRELPFSEEKRIAIFPKGLRNRF